jgi:hypothetical protein
LPRQVAAECSIYEQIGDCGGCEVRQIPDKIFSWDGPFWGLNDRWGVKNGFELHPCNSNRDDVTAPPGDAQPGDEPGARERWFLSEAGAGSNCGDRGRAGTVA